MNAEVTHQVERWDRFLASRAAALASDHGWLTLTSYQWLASTASPLHSVPGLWHASADSAVLSASTSDAT